MTNFRAKSKSFTGSDRTTPRGRFRTSTPPFPRGTCWSFHSGRHCRGCQYEHVCFKCGAKHPATQCQNQNSQLRTNPVKSGASISAQPSGQFPSNSRKSGHFVSAIKQMRFFFSACTSEYESSFRSFPIRITKNSRLLMFAAAILRSCDDRSVDRNYFSGVCNERKILEKFSEEPTIRREKSEATRLSRFSVPDLAVANPVFTVQSG